MNGSTRYVFDTNVLVTYSYLSIQDPVKRFGVPLKEGIVVPVGSRGSK